MIHMTKEQAETSCALLNSLVKGAEFVADEPDPYARGQWRAAWDDQASCDTLEEVSEYIWEYIG